MNKVAFVIEKEDPRFPIHKNSIDGYNQKKIKTLSTKNLLSKTNCKKSDYKNCLKRNKIKRSSKIFGKRMIHKLIKYYINEKKN